MYIITTYKESRWSPKAKDVKLIPSTHHIFGALIILNLKVGLEVEDKPILRYCYETVTVQGQKRAR